MLRPDRVYRWAQWICGLYSPDELPPTQVEATSARTVRKRTLFSFPLLLVLTLQLSDLKAVLSAIRRRMRARSLLHAQLDSLHKFQMPSNAGAAATTRVTLSAWRRCTAVDFEAGNTTTSVVPPAAMVR